MGLGEYARTRTMGLAKALGVPQTPLILNFGKDYAIYRLPR